MDIINKYQTGDYKYQTGVKQWLNIKQFMSIVKDLVKICVKVMISRMEIGHPKHGLNIKHSGFDSNRMIFWIDSQHVTLSYLE